MHGLDVMVGVSWGDVGDVGKAAFPYVHATGKGIASAFGAGAAADALESVEQKQGWLPPTQPEAAATVTSTVEKTTKGVAPKYTAAATKAMQQPSKSQPQATVTTPTAKPATAPQTQLSTTTIVVGVGVLGILTLLLHRWST